MGIFELYSDYYNLLYREKNYQHGAAYVNAFIKEHLPESKTILELGCGTGSHAIQLAGLGYWISGIDKSKSMLDQALSESSSQKKKIRSSPEGGTS